MNDINIALLIAGLIFFMIVYFLSRIKPPLSRTEIKREEETIKEHFINHMDGKCEIDKCMFCRWEKEILDRDKNNLNLVKLDTRVL